VPAPREVNAQRGLALLGVGPSELDNGIRPVAPLEAQRFAVRWLAVGWADDQVQIRPQCLARGSRHRTRRGVGGVARRDE
jgi:hypothetical protein